MIEITIKKVKKGFFKRVEVSGHSQAGYEVGKDILCSAVSAITQTALLGVLYYINHPINAKKKPDQKIHGKETFDFSGKEKRYITNSFKWKLGDGFFSIEIYGNTINDERIQAILTTLVLGLKKLAENNSQFISIIETTE